MPTSSATGEYEMMRRRRRSTLGASSANASGKNSPLGCTSGGAPMASPQAARTRAYALTIQRSASSPGSSMPEVL
jgi:hypothetical protein